MTQLMLFDTTATLGSSPAVAAPVGPVSATAGRETDSRSQRFAGENAVAEEAVTQGVTAEPGSAATSARLPEHEPGLNHMGDLARLVILRYQLVAKRRAERAQRERAQAEKTRAEKTVLAAMV